MNAFDEARSKIYAQMNTGPGDRTDLLNALVRAVRKDIANLIGVPIEALPPAGVIPLLLEAVAQHRLLRDENLGAESDDLAAEARDAALDRALALLGERERARGDG